MKKFISVHIYKLNFRWTKRLNFKKQNSKMFTGKHGKITF